MGFSGDTHVLYFLSYYNLTSCSFTAVVDVAGASTSSAKTIGNRGPSTENICIVVFATLTALSRAY